MSQNDIDPFSSSTMEREGQGHMSDPLPDTPDHSRRKTHLASILEIDTGLRFAECEEDLNEELLDASLERYQ